MVARTGHMYKVSAQPVPQVQWEWFHIDYARKVIHAHSNGP